MTVTDPDDERRSLQALLNAAIKRHGLGLGAGNLKRLSGGASQETWAFDLLLENASERPLILRRTPGGGEKTGSGVTLDIEAAVIAEARAHGVAAPEIACVLTAQDGLGPAYVMTRIEGETIARKILRDEQFAAARPLMARQCGEILARLHRVPVDRLGMLPLSGATEQWHQYRDIYDGFQEPRPVFEYAFRWLQERLPAQGPTALVHGDFRNGNLMVGPEGVRAVLDWELTHLGDPMEDLGWICVNSWRFGQSQNPVGGFGQIADLAAGYESAGGGKVDLDRVAFWQVFGTLKWGVMCMIMVSAYRTGADRSVERAAIGRRASETEIDLINLIAAPGA